MILAELVERFIDRFHGGEPVEVRAFAAEHPEHAEALLELLPAAATMAELRRSSLGTDRRPRISASTPTSIGGYRIVREIGRGGMGVVYEAVQVCDRPQGRPQGAPHLLRRRTRGRSSGSGSRGRRPRRWITRISSRSSRSAASRGSTSMPCDSSKGARSPP